MQNPSPRPQLEQTGDRGQQIGVDAGAHRERCVPHLVAAQAAARPNAVAVTDGENIVRYNELHARTQPLAHALRRMGVGRDVLVGLCVERSAAFVLGALGILKAGGAYVPLDPASPPDRLAFQLRDSGAPVVLTQRHLHERLPSGAWRVVDLDDTAWQPHAMSTDAHVATLRTSDLAYVIYTSGSTGQPKGVEISHGSLLNLVHWHRFAFAITPDDRATQVASPAFDAAVWELWPYLTAGASVHIPDDHVRNTPELLRDWLVRHRITMTFLPTPVAERALDLHWPQETSLRFLLTGGDTLHRYPPATLPFTVINNYGVTETTVVTTSGRVTALDAQCPLPPIGRPIAHTRVYILDDQLQPVAPGVAGELYVGGIGVARGYHQRPRLTDERFIADPFSAVPGSRLYRTGDRAALLPDGQLMFLGRMDAQVKIRGHRVEPDEIVAILNRHAAVQASTVVAREDTLSGKHLVAYVVPATEARPAASTLRAILAEQLPDYMVPAVFVWLDRLPLTINGKVDRAALPIPDAANIAPDREYEPPRTPLEAQLAGILADVLGLERVGRYDNFFLLHGHSLLGAQVVARINDAFGLEIALYSLFAAPTVAELAVEVEQLLVSRLAALSDDEVQHLLR